MPLGLGLFRSLETLCRIFLKEFIKEEVRPAVEHLRVAHAVMARVDAYKSPLRTPSRRSKAVMALEDAYLKAVWGNAPDPQWLSGISSRDFRLLVESSVVLFSRAETLFQQMGLAPADYDLGYDLALVA